MNRSKPRVGRPVHYYSSASYNHGGMINDESIKPKYQKFYSSKGVQSKGCFKIKRVKYHPDGKGRDFLIAYYKKLNYQHKRITQTQSNFCRKLKKIEQKKKKKCTCYLIRNMYQEIYIVVNLQ